MIWEEFRELKEELFGDFQLPEITLTRTKTGERTPQQKAAGQAGTITTTVFTGRGKIKPRETRLADGTLIKETVALLDVEPMVGDRFEIANRSYKVVACSENAPDGRAGITFEAVLK